MQSNSSKPLAASASVQALARRTIIPSRCECPNRLALGTLDRMNAEEKNHREDEL
ncbi:hypothetical protein D3C81_2273150 [compost metagenome]